MYYNYSPLEQFEIFPVFAFQILPKVTTESSLFIFFPAILSLANHLCTFILIIAIIFFAGQTLLFDTRVVKKNWQNGLFNYLKIIRSIIFDLNSHPFSKNYYFIFFMVVFAIINIINVIGLIPYTFVLTSQFFFTFGLAFLFFMTINITGIIYHGTAFFNLFYPSGTPLFIVPLLVLIELVSYIARVFSLAIRLFANITAGHILVKILSWLTWMILDFFLLSSVSFIIISALWVLEFFISILQAYVFLTLLCLYLNDVLILH